MSTPATNGNGTNGDRVAHVGERKVMSYADYLARVEAERKSHADELAEIAQQYIEASRRYQESLRAIPDVPAGQSRRDRMGLEQMPVEQVAAGGLAEPIVRLETDLKQERVTDELTDHNYDGIQEYDNPTPGWWYLVFVASVVFSVFYVFFYHMSGFIPSLGDQHDLVKARALEEQFAEINALSTGEAKILKIMSQESWLAGGEALFQQKCALCHAADGAGLVGPNLTDDKYKNVAGLMDIPDLVLNGAGGNAMPAQRGLMSQGEIDLVSAYVAALRGKNLPTNPAVQPNLEGELIAPWPTLSEDGKTVIPAAPASGSSASLR